MSIKLPRGIRIANPGNIRHGDKWQGLAAVQADPSFCTFRSPAFGIRALARLLITYQDKHGLRAIEPIIERWAPDVENNTEAYIQHVVQISRFGRTQILNMHEYRHLRPIVEAIIRHENGRGPLKTANSWYSVAVIDEALHMAGVPRPVAEVSRVPVNVETVGATATGAIGVTQMTEVMPLIADAAMTADGHLSSGSILRAVIALALVGVSVWIAYSQVKKHQQGLV